jgi:hypothetical protein
MTKNKLGPLKQNFGVLMYNSAVEPILNQHKDLGSVSHSKINISSHYSSPEI